MARWCSRLARQPVTLEVDGSSPFRVAIKPEQSFGSAQYASVAQLVEQRTENPRVVGSIPPGGPSCGCSSSGRAPPCQGGGSEFEPRHPLQKEKRPASAGLFSFWNWTATRLEDLKCNSPVDCCSPGLDLAKLLFFFPSGKENANEPRHPLRKKRTTKEVLFFSKMGRKRSW